MYPETPPRSSTRFPSRITLSLRTYADDLGLALSTVRNYRFAAHRWPQVQRRQGVSHKVHCILASIGDDTERFELSSFAGALQ